MVFLSMFRVLLMDDVLVLVCFFILVSIKYIFWWFLSLCLVICVVCVGLVIIFWCFGFFFCKFYYRFLNGCDFGCLFIGECYFLSVV